MTVAEFLAECLEDLAARIPHGNAERDIWLNRAKWERERPEPKMMTLWEES